MSPYAEIGSDIRALRKSRSMTLEAMAENLGRSLGWVSQIERGISTPTINDLRAIADMFEVPLSLFFGSSEGQERERGRVVRAENRRAIGSRDTGLVETLISPDLTDDYEMVHSTFLPGAGIEDFVERPTTEVVYLISGRLDIWLGDDKFTVDAGDSFRIRDTGYRWANPYSTPAVAVWVISPPIY